MSRLSLTTRVSLANAAEGWTDDQFLNFKVMDSDQSMDYSDEVKNVKGEDGRGYLELFKKYAKENFVDGKVLVDGKTVEAEIDDVDDLPAAILTDIFYAISRSKFSDPKASTK